MAQNVEELIVSLQADVSDFKKKMNQAGNTAENTGRQGSKGMGKMGVAMAALGPVVAGVTAAIGSMGVAMKGIEYNANLEQSTIAWKTLLGTTEEAEKRMKDISDFAKKTQFDVGSIDSMAKYFHNAELSGKELWGELTQIADVSGAFNVSADAAKEMARQMAQVRNAGVAYTEDLNILEDRGVPIMKTIAKNLGITTAEAKKMAGQGKITSDIYNEAFDSIAKSVEGAAEDQSKTFNGMMSTLKDNMNMLMGEMTKPLFEFAKTVLATVLPLVEKLNEAFKNGGIKEAINTLFDFGDGGGIAEQFDKMFGKGTLEGIVSTFKSLGESIKKYINMSMKIWKKFGPVVFKIIKDLTKYIGKILIPLITGMAEIYKENLDKITKFWEENGDEIIRAAKNVWAIISGVIETVMPVIQYVIENALNVIRIAFDFTFSTIMSLVKIFSKLFTGDWKGLWEEVKTLFDGIVNTVVELFTTGFIGDMLRFMNGFRDKMITKFNEFVNGVFTKVSNGFTNIKNSILDRLHQVFIEAPIKMGKAIFQIIKVVNDKVDSFKKTVKEFVLNGIYALVSKLREFYLKGKEFVTKIVEGIKEKVTAFKESVTSLVTEGKKKLEEKANAMWTVGRDIVEGIVSGITKNLNKIRKAAEELAATAKNKIKDFLGIKSPSRVTKEYGKFLGIGLALGMEEEEKNVGKQGEKLAESVLKPLGDLQAGVDVKLNKVDMSTALKNADLNAKGYAKAQVEKEMKVELRLRGGLEKIADEIEAVVMNRLNSSIGGSI